MTGILVADKLCLDRWNRINLMEMDVEFWRALVDS